MNNKNKNETSPFGTERPRGLKAAVILGAGGAAVGAVIGVGNFVSHNAEPDKAAAEQTAEQAHFEYKTDLPHDIQDSLVYIQGSHDHDITLAPTDIPSVTLNQTGENTLVIVDGAGGLNDQAIAAYKAAHGLENDQLPSMTVQESILLTTDVLSQRNHAEGADNTPNAGDKFTMIELKDADGNDLVVVADGNESSVN